jgi:hypothetical protein
LCLSAGNRKNPIGNVLARAAKNLLSLGAPDCPVVHRTVSGALAGSSKVAALETSTAVYGYNSSDCPVGRSQANSSLSGIHRRRTTIIHRTVRCAPDCPVCTGLSGEPTVGRANGRPGQRSAAQSVRDTWSSQRLEEGTGQRLSSCQRSTAPFMERNRAPDMSGVHRTVRCASRQKARSAFLDCSQRLLAALGL